MLNQLNLDWQTWVALLIVALAVVTVWKKLLGVRKSAGSGSHCGACSNCRQAKPDVDNQVGLIQLNGQRKR